jgi:hypothetical protein
MTILANAKKAGFFNFSNRYLNGFVDRLDNFVKLVCEKNSRKGLIGNFNGQLCAQLGVARSIHLLRELDNLKAVKLCSS